MANSWFVILRGEHYHQCFGEIFSRSSEIEACSQFVCDSADLRGPLAAFTRGSEVIHVPVSDVVIAFDLADEARAIGFFYLTATKNPSQ